MKLEIDLWITAMIFIIDFRPLKRRATLKTLKILKILTALSELRAPLPLIKESSTKLNMTMKPSIKFILSLSHF